jgi:hypothetical protein
LAVKFDYLPDGCIAGVKDTFSAFNEPSDPIPAAVTALTGITDEMVAGHRIDEDAVTAFVDDAVILDVSDDRRRQLNSYVLAEKRLKAVKVCSRGSTSRR